MAASCASPPSGSWARRAATPSTSAARWPRSPTATPRATSPPARSRSRSPGSSRASRSTPPSTRPRPGFPSAPGHEETLGALRAARALAASGAAPGPEAVATLGAGWVADEALAIGVYGALVARDYAHGVLVAANHSGDSDSTAAIAGSILGMTLGPDAIPPAWLAELELRDEIERLAADWVAAFGADGSLPAGLAERYPGW